MAKTRTGANTKRRLALSLAAMALAMALAVMLAAPPAKASATFTVDSTTDAPDADPGDGACSTAANECTLRAAIGEANALPGDDVVGFDPSVSGTITLGGSELYINSNLEINGPGADVLSVSANNKSRVFKVQGGTVEIGGLTITGGVQSWGAGILNYYGTLTVSSSIIRGNTANWEGGGGIRNEVGTLTVSDSTITGNTAGRTGGGGGGIENRGGTLTVERSTISGNTANDEGGGIDSYSHPAPASLTITDSTISGNTATSGYGGGVANSGPLRVSNSTITENEAGREGGGISNRGGTLTVSASTITDNATDTDGGGIYNSGRDVTVSDTTISGNTTTGDGGGIYTGHYVFGATLTVERSTISDNEANDGGGIYSRTYHYEHGLSDKTTITNTTISSNTATDGYGGGLYNFTGLTEIGHSTITANTAPTDQGSGVASLGNAEYARTEVHSSIVSGNQNTDVDSVADPEWDTDWDSVNSFVSEGYNVIGDGNATSAFDKSGDQRGVSDPKLGALADNGGPTLTHALLEGSPAIDRGNSPNTTTDQRGQPRPKDFRYVPNATAGDGSDAGTFEAQVLPNAAPSIKVLSPKPRSEIRDHTPTIRATVEDSGTDLSKYNIRLYLDGRRIKNFSYNTSTDGLSYTSKRLERGGHRVLIVATDQQGLKEIRVWGFKVAKR